MDPADYNMRHAMRWCIRPADLGAEDWSDLPAIKRWQGERKLTADGLFGPRSRRVYLKERYPWTTDKGWASSHIRNRPRKRLPLSIVLHDTITHNGRSAYRVLEARRLGTHVIFDLDGTVRRSADPVLHAPAHAGAWNDEAIGFDIAAILDPKFATYAKERERIVPRAWSNSVAMRGHIVDYTEEQIEGLPAAVGELCDTYGIPRIVPAQLTPYGQRLGGISDEYFRGVIAHGQGSSKRWDGLRAVEILLASGEFERLEI